MGQLRLTRLGKVFLALMLLFYGAAVTSQSGLLLLMIGLVGGCFAVNASFARRNVRHALVTAPRDVRLVEGVRLTEPWRIENRSTKHLEMIEAFARDALLFRVRVVEVGDTVSVIPQTVFDRRGVYPYSQVVIASSAPYGLLRASKAVTVPGGVIVYPQVYETSSPAGSGLDLVTGGRLRGRRRVNTGTHFAGVRPWEPGDALKQVHWNTTARRDQLMVKTFEEELGGRVSVILDCEPAVPGWIDDAVRAAASLAVATLQDGHHLEFFAGAEAAPLRLAPFADEDELLDRLARYEPCKAGFGLDAACLWRKSAIALVGPRFREEWKPLIEEAARLNRAVHVYVRKQAEVPSTGAAVWEFTDDEILPRAQSRAVFG